MTYPPRDGTGIYPARQSIPDTALDLGFDPGEHTITEVRAYLTDQPDQTIHVLSRERAGRNRITLTGD